MAKKTKDEKAEQKAITKLVPQSTKVLVDGQEIIVAANAQENDILNKIVVGQVRTALTEALKRYKDKDMLPTPRELKELTAAVKEMTELSANVYKGSKSIDEVPEQKNVTKTDADEDIIDFDAAKEEGK